MKIRMLGWRANPRDGILKPGNREVPTELAKELFEFGQALPQKDKFGVEDPEARVFYDKVIKAKKERERIREAEAKAKEAEEAKAKVEAEVRARMEIESAMLIASETASRTSSPKK